MLRIVGVFWGLAAMAAAGAAQTVLSQPATSSSLGGGGSDSGCTFTGTPGTTSTLADDFVLTAARDISGVRFQGGYFSPVSPAHPPAFTVRLWTDSAGEPGSVLATPILNVSETPVTVSGNLWVYSYTASFSAPVSLGPGAYWIEILETDATLQVCFTWSSGVLDPVNGRNGAAVQFPINGTWLPQATDNYALTVLAGGLAPVAAVPALGGWGLFALIGGLTMAAWVLLRRAPRKSFVGR